MAKKKNAEAAVAAPPSTAEGRATAELRKLFGDGVVISGGDVVDAPREVIPVSPRLDHALGGGFLVGTLVTLAGPSGCGKTTTALHFAAKWQQRGGKVYYIAAENRIWSRDLTGIPGLDAAAMEIIGSHEGRIMTAQDFLLAADTILRNAKDALVIIDSFSILSEESEMTAREYAQGAPGGANRLVGSFCRRMAPIIPINGNLVIGIAHLYTNIGGKKKWAVSLPIKVNHARATGLLCEWAEPTFDGEDPLGQVVHWKVERSPLGPPNKKVDSIIRYGIGIDEVAEAVDLGIELGLVAKSGTWLSFPFAADQKVQGREQARDFLAANPDHLAALLAKLRYFHEP